MGQDLISWHMRQMLQHWEVEKFLLTLCRGSPRGADAIPRDRGDCETDKYVR